jgi:hypothetical protein
VREELQLYLDADPFVPFQITMTGGQAYVVRNPGLVIVGRDVIYYAHPNSDHNSVLRLVQIVAIDTIGQAYVAEDA